MNHEETIFDRALEINSEAAREEFLRDACAGDDAMFERLQGLLRAHDRAGRFLEHARPTEGAPAFVVPSRVRDGAAPGPAEAGTTSLLTEKPGDRIGRYKLLQKIGEGGCGVVYMAEQEEPVRRRVALKIIKLGMDTRQVIARFEAERQALALMDHPNIAKVFDAGVTGFAESQISNLKSQIHGGRPYFVMELVRGVKITEYCDQQKLSTQERLELFMQVCRAVQHAHQKGIIHRDLKPSNILVSMNDGVAVPKVIDFGIAKATSGEPLTDKTIFTAFEQFIGTPAYMSPEQALVTSLDIDTRTDIYSLGVLLYELLTGHTPFDAKELLQGGLEAMRRTICEREPQRPSTRLSTIPGGELSTTAQRRGLDAPKLLSQLRGDLDWIVMKCLEKDRARRYETANGLATDIQRHLSNEPVVACPPSKLYRFQKMVRRNKLAFAAGTGIAAALVIGLAIAFWQFVERTRAYNRAVVAEKAAQAEAAKSDQVAEFLKDMLKSVDSSVAMGRDTTLLREILDRTAERIEKDFSNRPEVEADLGNTIGTVYNELYEFKKAEALFRRGLALRRTLPGNQNRKIASSLMGLAHALWRQGKNAEGEKRVREAIEIQKNLPDGEKLNTATVYNSLGLTVRDQGRTAEAEAIFREGWATVRQPDKNLPPLLFSLAYMLASQGKFPEAEKVYKEGIAISANLNFAHQSMAEMHDNLANTLVAQGKGAESLIFLRQGVEMRRKLFGSDSPAVGSALLGMARALRKQGNRTEAEAALREALEITQKGLARKDPEAVSTVAGLAPALADAGRWTEVEPLIRECHVLAKEYIAVGQKSFRSQRLSGALGSLGWALRNQAMHGEAETIFQYALALVDKDEPSYYNRVNDVALALFAQDKLAEAEAMFREALASNSRNPQHDQDLVVLLNNLGDALSGQGRIEEGKVKYAEAQAAERIALAKAAENSDAKAQNSLAWMMATSRNPSLRDGKKAVDLAKKSVAASNRTNPMTLDTLAAAYAEAGQFTNAVAVQQEAMGLLKNEVEEKDFARRLKLYTLHLPFRDFGYDVLLQRIENLRRHRKFAEAETMLREALDTIEADSIGKGDPQVASGLKDIGTEAQLRSTLVNIYNDLGDYAKAEEMMRRVLELQKNFFGEESLDVAASLHTLSWLLLEQQNRTKLAEAEEKARAAVELKRKLLGDEDVGTASSLDLIAMVLQRKGDLAEAEETQREVVRIWEKSKGPAHPSSLSALNNLGVTLLSQGKLAEAENVLRRCWNAQTNQNRWLTPNALRVLGNFAAVLDRQGKWSEAETALTNLLALQKKQLSDTHPDVLSRMSQLAGVLRAQNKLEESASLHQQILMASQKGYGSNSLQVLGARTAWAGVLREQHQWHEAEVQLWEVIRLIRQLNPDDHQAEANALRDLTGVLMRQGKRLDAEKTYQETLQIHATLISNASEPRRELRRRAEFFARFGRWNEAVADVKRALALKPDDDETSHLLTPLLIQFGDFEAYREHCRSQIERFKYTDKPSTAYRVAKDGLMLPSSGVDLTVAAGLADVAVRLGRRPRDEFCKSLAEYRQGRFPSAAERLEKLLTQERQDFHLEIEARLVLGMVYHHLRRTDEARAAIAEGITLAEKKLPRLDESDLGDDPSNCIWANALIREARALLQNTQETVKK